MRGIQKDGSSEGAEGGPSLWLVGTDGSSAPGWLLSRLGAMFIKTGNTCQQVTGLRPALSQ